MEIVTNLGVIAGLLAAIIGTLYLLLGTFYKKRRLFRKHFSVVLNKSSKLTKEDVLKTRPCESFYFRRPELDDSISKGIKKGKNILILGPPLSGKSRAVFETLKKINRPSSVNIARHENINRADFSFPRQIYFWRKVITFIDDLQRYVEQQNFDCMIEEALIRRNILIVVCRSGDEWKKAKTAMQDKDLQVETIFENIVEFNEKLSRETSEKIAEDAGIKWDTVRFNGTIGSIFMPLAEIEKRYEKCEKEDKTILLALKELYVCGIYRESDEFPLDWVKTAASRHGLNGDKLDWETWLGRLKGKELVFLKNNTIISEEVYLEYIVRPRVSDETNLFKAMLSLFSGKHEALIRLARRVYAIGIVREEKASLMTICIQAFEEALNLFTLEHFPMDYGIIQDDLANAYRALAEVENTAENCIKAIKACKEALKVRRIEAFPKDYGITQNTLGNTYSILAEVEDTAENCRRAIKAYEEALKVYTLDSFSIQYGAIYNNMSATYIILSRVENRAENCIKAIKACKEALKVRRIEAFPKDYGTTQVNLGSAYYSMGKIENTAVNCREAIKAYGEALKVYNRSDSPEMYSIIIRNLNIINEFCKGNALP
jgi:tetratricopeptide (TPR) repeat protein